MSDITSTSWSETDASNNQFAPEGWAAGMFPNAVEPTARMMMGAQKRFWNRVNPVYAATLSTTDSFVVTPSVALTGYGLYERWRVRFPNANTSTSPNLVISSLPAMPIRKYNTSGSLIALAKGDIQQQDHGLWWDGQQIILENPVQLPAATIATLALGGTGADLSATGGASQVVKQASTGAAFTVGSLASTNLSDSANLVKTTDSSALQRLGSGTTVSGTAAVTFGNAFPTACDGAVVTGSGGSAVFFISAKSASGLTVGSAGGDGAFFYLAWGH